MALVNTFLLFAVELFMFACVEVEPRVPVHAVVPVVAELNVGVGVALLLLLLNKMDALVDFNENEALDDETMDKSG